VSAPRRRLLSPLPFSLPSVFVAASWIGLWFLWPGGTRLAPESARGVCSTPVAYLGTNGIEVSRYRLPTLFVQSAGEAAGKAQDEDDAVAALATREVNRPPLLARPPAALRPALPPLPTASALAAAGETAYVPAWEKAAEFAAPVTAERRVVLSLSPSLKACGYALPKGTTNLVAVSDKPWEATLYVELGEDGAATDAFAESSSAEPRVTSALVRLLLLGRAPAGAGGGAGRVRVSCNRQ
jgi:hypothetical protein